MNADEDERFRLAQKLDGLAQFHSGLAHDINNQMTTLLGNLSILESMYPEEAELLQDMTTAADAVADLIRLEQVFCKQERMPDHAVSFSGQLHALRDLLDRTLGNEITLDWTIGEQASYIKGDESILDQVILNLFLEARVRMATSPTAVLQASLDVSGPSAVFRLSAGDLEAVTFAWPPADVPHPDPSEMGRGVGLAYTRMLLESLGGILEISGDDRSLDIRLQLPEIDPLSI